MSSSTLSSFSGPINDNITGRIQVEYKKPATTTVDHSVKNARHIYPAPNIVKHTPKKVLNAACIIAGPMNVIVNSTLLSSDPLLSMNSCIICAD